ncbi:MAG: hypothetical protein JWM56_247 [Candidatus Peribacteria bacterium]|nr:hypothetical protein [Candidatus Peribacteria bacterium]
MTAASLFTLNKEERAVIFDRIRDFMRLYPYQTEKDIQTSFRYRDNFYPAERQAETVTVIQSCSRFTDFVRLSLPNHDYISH